MLAHYVAGEPDWKAELERSMYTEAGWGLGRNPGNIVEMTGLGERRIHASRNHAWQDGHAGLSLRNKTLARLPINPQFSHKLLPMSWKMCKFGLL